jgi:hypothetical protein
MGVKLGLSDYGKNIDWGYLRTRVVTIIFGRKTDKVAGDWRKLQNKEHHNF